MTRKSSGARVSETGAAAATPFVKWPGGKRALIPSITRHFPDHVPHYWEPFVGGGAVFFAFAERIERATLSDTNEHLMTTYTVVRDRVDELIARLGEHERSHRRRAGKQYADGNTYYYRVRESEPTEAVAVAARLIYLNRTCYNGLYRVNKTGRFNVPEGSYKNPDICNPVRLRKSSAALARARIVPGTFERTVQPGAGHFVYCDPPYDGTFNSYHAAGFPGAAQSRLRCAAERWRASGATVLLSNADTPAMRCLYAGFAIEQVAAPRSINSDRNGRGHAPELLIRTSR